VKTAESVVGYIRGKPRERWISDKHGKQSMKGKQKNEEIEAFAYRRLCTSSGRI